MATVKQYALQLWSAHKTVCQKLGSDITWGSVDERVRVLGTDVMLGTLIKVLVDQGVVTNAQLTAAYNAVTSATFPSLPPDIAAPDTGQTVPDPDLGS